MSREIGTEALPSYVAVARAVQVLRPVVNVIRRMRRNFHRRDALKTVNQFCSRVAVKGLRANPIALLISRRKIPAAELAFATSKNDFRIPRVRNNRPSLASRSHAEILSVPQRKARNNDRGVVLLRAINAIRILVVYSHLIDFGLRLLGLRPPATSPVASNIRPAT